MVGNPSSNDNVVSQTTRVFGDYVLILWISDGDGKYISVLIILSNGEVFSVALNCSENITVNFAVLVAY